jgi:hypothetical protein
MPWTYSQSTGQLSQDGTLVAIGYSGFGPGKNNPADEAIRNVGPIPRGEYAIGAMQATSAAHGPDIMPLTPVGHDALGRSGFLMHGDSIANPGTASEGCIIMPHNVRLQVANSGDSVLDVVE